MDEETKTKIILNFRYGLIAPIVTKLQLHPGETQAHIENAAKKTYKIPYSTKTQVSARTIERYLKIYRERGYDGLAPKYLSGKTSSTRIPLEYLDKAKKLKEENLKRSIPQIIDILEMADKVPKGILKRSTVYDYFVKNGIARAEVENHTKTYQRFAAKHRNQRWQGDACHLIHLPIEENPKKCKKVYLIAWIDDFSRLIIHAQCYFEENSYCLEDSLKKAILKYGLPSQIYVDNGKIYSSKQLNSVCGKLTVQLSHSRPYRPAGRGKVERFFQTVQSSFLPEIEVMLRDRVLSLEELNKFLFVWIRQHYHEKIHSATKQKPIVRFESDPTPIRTVSFDKLEDAFLLEEERTVTKQCIFQFRNLEFPVERELARSKVLVRFNPFDLSTVQVHFDGKRYDVSPLDPGDVPENVDYKKLNRKPPTDEPEKTGLNYLDELVNKDKEGLSYKKLR